MCVLLWLQYVLVLDALIAIMKACKDEENGVHSNVTGHTMQRNV